MAKGSCLCSQIEYEYTGEPETTALCHCKDCQKWTGSGCTANVVVKSDNFKILRGEDVIKTYDVTGASGKNNRHYFCSNCGSSLMTVLDLMPGMTIIKSGGLDDGKNNHPINVEFYTKDRLGYAKEVQGAKQETHFG